MKKVNTKYNETIMAKINQMNKNQKVLNMGRSNLLLIMSCLKKKYDIVFHRTK